MHQADWFKQRMRRLRVTQEQIGRALNRDRTVVGRILSGQQPLKLNEVLPLAEILQVSPFEILHRAGMWDGKAPAGLRQREEWFGLFEEMPPEEQARAIAMMRAYRSGGP